MTLLRHAHTSRPRRALAARRGVLTVLALLLGAGFAAPVRAVIVNRILATIDGEPVTLFDLKQFTERNVRARQLPGVDQAVLLDALITDRIIQKEVSAQGIVIRDEEIDRYLQNIKDRNQITDQQLRAALAQQGVTWEGYRTQVREDLQRVQLINREIRGKVNVTPEEVQRYYEAHLADYATAEGVTVSHILLRLPERATPDQVDATMARATGIHAELKSGADFAELAKRSSEDPAAQQGGKLGTFKEGEMLDAVERVVKTLQPGHFSEPFRSPVGIHIVRVDAKSGSSHQPLDSLADEIKERLYNAALEERYSRWLKEDLRQRHHVELQP